MAMPSRRSSRISSGSSLPRKPATPVANKLSSLLERDESPDCARPNIDALVVSPTTPSAVANTARFGICNSAVKTPQTASRIMPPKEEMHPSKVHQSTSKPSATRGPLSSHPVVALARSPSKIAIPVGKYDTPIKSSSTLPLHMTSPSFDFSFERPESDLSAEAQKIMDSVREEAAKIKTQMIEERSKQEHKDGVIDQLYGVGGRQIRKAKGKSGRFSDVHKHEFKKMDSIADHASAWKHKLQDTASSSLKRSPSKAGLDDMPKSLPRSKSLKSFCTNATERLENNASGKRAKRAHKEDTSTARPDSRGNVSGLENTQSMPVKFSPVPALPSAVTTPTKASLARSASVKSLKISMIPSLSTSASTKTLASPYIPKTEGNNKRIGSWSKFGGSMKSILHRSKPKFSNDPGKVAAGTHLPVPQRNPDVGKELPSLPGTPTVKRVNFSPSTKCRHEIAVATNSPIPSKIPMSPTRQAPQHGVLPSAAIASVEDQVSYPDLGASPNITTRAKSPRPATKSPSGPGDFTFRTADTITFSPAGFASPSGTSTIRPVRPSGIPTFMPGLVNKEMPAIPHGMSNKKRKHVSSDDEDVENTAPQGVDVEVDQHDRVDGQPSTKKQRVTGPFTSTKGVQKLASPSKHRMTGTGVGGSRIPNKGVLSLSRLNVLARPKNRR